MSPARRDYKPGRKQAAQRVGAQRGRGAAKKPLATPPKAICRSSDSDYTDSSFETVRPASSLLSTPTHMIP